MKPEVTEPLNLPSPTELYGKGLQFALATVFPPILSERIFKDEVVSYRKIIKPDLYWYSGILDFFSIRRHWFIAFVDEKRYDQPIRPYPVSITRAQLTKAWIIGLNGYRFHDGLLEWISTKKTGDDPKTVEIKALERAERALQQSADQWIMLHSQVDIAMNLLHEYENSLSAPRPWAWQSSYDIKRLSRPDLMEHDCDKFHIKAIFIHAALHLLELDKVGYNQEFLDLAKIVGFPGVKACRLPGLSSYDDIAEEEGEVISTGAGGPSTREGEEETLIQL
ncbi:hypothetical protein V865_004747 [Kwoniella europaea PYCC6329]|uniref:Uncharacterized protein n=1 Tax=Kwoniella europaea PYCC6329 TaxID=1423913 RepID=A0AAX4KKV4_9TREE